MMPPGWPLEGLMLPETEVPLEGRIPSEAELPLEGPVEMLAIASRVILSASLRACSAKPTATRHIGCLWASESQGPQT